MPYKFECPNCHEDVIVRYLSKGEIARCRNCFAETEVPAGAVEISASGVEELARERRVEITGGDTVMRSYAPYAVDLEGRGKIVFLKTMAWIMLIGGCLFGLLSIIIGIANPTGGETPGSFGVFMGLVVIGNALAMFALFMVVASIADHMILMHRQLSFKAKPPNEAAGKGPAADTIKIKESNVSE